MVHGVETALWRIEAMHGHGTRPEEQWVVVVVWVRGPGAVISPVLLDSESMQ